MRELIFVQAALVVYQQKLLNASVVPIPRTYLLRLFWRLTLSPGRPSKIQKVDFNRA